MESLVDDPLEGTDIVLMPQTEWAKWLRRHEEVMD